MDFLALDQAVSPVASQDNAIHLTTHYKKIKNKGRRTFSFLPWIKQSFLITWLEQHFFFTNNSRDHIVSSERGHHNSAMSFPSRFQFLHRKRRHYKHALFTQSAKTIRSYSCSKPFNQLSRGTTLCDNDHMWVRLHTISEFLCFDFHHKVSKNMQRCNMNHCFWITWEFCRPPMFPCSLYLLPWNFCWLVSGHRSVSTARLWHLWQDLKKKKKKITHITLRQKIKLQFEFESRTQMMFQITVFELSGVLLHLQTNTMHNMNL